MPRIIFSTLNKESSQSWCISMNIITKVEIHTSIELLVCYVSGGPVYLVTPGEVPSEKIQKVAWILVLKLSSKVRPKEIRNRTLQEIHKSPYWVKCKYFI